MSASPVSSRSAALSNEHPIIATNALPIVIKIGETEKKILDLSVSRLQVFDKENYARIKQALKANAAVTHLELRNYVFEDDTLFAKLVAKIAKYSTLKLVTMTTKEMQENHFQQLHDLIGRNDKKSLQFRDAEGLRLPYQLDQSGYIASKASEAPHKDYLADVRDTTRISHLLAEKRHGKQPDVVIDYGAGDGPCTIPLILLGCENVYAVDACEEALDNLEVNLHRAAAEDQLKNPFKKYGTVTTVTKEFINAELPQADLFIDEFTSPYRKPSDFPAMWKKKVSCIKAGGVMACQLFTRPTKPQDDSMTYHSVDEAITLLRKDFAEIYIYEQTSGFKVYTDGVIDTADNPDIREWGNLVHVIAIKRQNDVEKTVVRKLDKLEECLN